MAYGENGGRVEVRRGGKEEREGRSRGRERERERAREYDFKKQGRKEM